MNALPSRSWASRALAFFRDAHVPRWKKLLGVLALLYAVFPLDAIPDAIPVLGWLDDVGVLSAVAAYLLREIQRHRPS